MITFERHRTQLIISFNDTKVFAFANIDDWECMVPVTNDIPHPAIVSALNTYWPWTASSRATILWPEDLDVQTVAV